jgi:hypothetical protein
MKDELQGWRKRAEKAQKAERNSSKLARKRFKAIKLLRQQLQMATKPKKLSKKQKRKKKQREAAISQWEKWECDLQKATTLKPIQILVKLNSGPSKVITATLGQTTMTALSEKMGIPRQVIHECHATSKGHPINLGATMGDNRLEEGDTV